jgi:pimeloyl-ACP methyl ester carboxylesterase
MSTYVLVHGAWGGGWYWSRAARRLRDAGHDVFTPSLTGLGDRKHLLGPTVGLETHIQDILQLLRHERLSDVVLVGHSYGGMVISGVADTAPERIQTLVYLDAALPESGQAMFDFLPPARRARFIELARSRGDGWMVPPQRAADWGVDDPNDQEWLDGLFGFQPLKAFTDTIQLSGRHLSIDNKVFILAARYSPSPFQPFAERTRADSSWTNYELPTFHFTMVQMPNETADLLLRHAEQQSHA